MKKRIGGMFMVYYHAVSYSTNVYKKSEVVCTTRTYNKIKKAEGFKEYDYAKFDYNPMHIQQSLDYKIKELGLSNFAPDSLDGCVFGKLGSSLYGYAVYRKN